MAENNKFSVIDFEGVDDEDKERIRVISQMMLSIHGQNPACSKWFIEQRTDYYKIVCKYPLHTIFQKRKHLELIDAMSPEFIQDIWIEYDTDTINLVCQVRRHDKPIKVIIQTVKILQTIITSPHTKIISTSSTDVFNNDGEYNSDEEFVDKQKSKKRKKN